MEDSLISIGKSLIEITDILKQPWNIRDWIFSVTPFILTIISIVLAIYVPYRIMSKQNKIAVFEKRYNIFQEIENVVAFSNSVKSLKELPNKKNQVRMNYQPLCLVFGLTHTMMSKICI